MTSGRKNRMAEDNDEQITDLLPEAGKTSAAVK